jgi:hypothetical protein
VFLDVSLRLLEIIGEPARRAFRLADENARIVGRRRRAERGQIDSLPFDGQQLLAPPEGEEHRQHEVGDDFALGRAPPRPLNVLVPLRQSSLAAERREQLVD